LRGRTKNQAIKSRQLPNIEAGAYPPDCCERETARTINTATAAKVRI
jgi:hypothetical protein